MDKMETNKRLKNEIEQLKNIVSGLLQGWKAKHPEDFQLPSDFKLMNGPQKIDSILPKTESVELHSGDSKSTLSEPEAKPCKKCGHRADWHFGGLCSIPSGCKCGFFVQDTKGEIELFDCHECGNLKPCVSDNLRGVGKYCGECIGKLMREDAEDTKSAPKDKTVYDPYHDYNFTLPGESKEKGCGKPTTMYKRVVEGHKQFWNCGERDGGYKTRFLCDECHKDRLSEPKEEGK